MMFTLVLILVCALPPALIWVAVVGYGGRK
jgi:hypothetical protein